MTEMLEGTRAPSDPELISGVRSGNLDAYGELFSRHTDAARRLARQLTRGSDAEDLVSEAFTKVMGVLTEGGGPDVAFRAYLLTAIRRLYVDRVRRDSRLTNSDDMTAFDAGVPFQDTVVAEFESSAAARAFATLPERWQLVLWHLEVENQKPADIALLLGMSPNSVCALAYRAREGLRQAFLSAHLADTSDAECRWTVEHLGGYVRKGLAKRDSTKVKAHLDACRSCTAMYLELTEVNSDLRGIIAPLLLGSAAAGYLAGAGSGGGVPALMVLLGRARDALFGASGTSAGTTTGGHGGHLCRGGRRHRRGYGGRLDRQPRWQPRQRVDGRHSRSHNGSSDNGGRRHHRRSGGRGGRRDDRRRLWGPPRRAPRAVSPQGSAQPASR